MNIYAVPTIGENGINKPELTLIFNSDVDSSVDINQKVLNSYNHLISEGKLKADGFSLFIRGSDNQVIPLQTLPLHTESDIQRPNHIPFACNRYMSIDASYIEEHTKKIQHKINFMSPLSFISQEQSFESMEDYINYNKKQRTVSAWLELLSEAQAFILGDYHAIKILLAQLPNITHENFKEAEVLAFTADNVFTQFNDIFLSNFVHHELKRIANEALVKHEADSLYELNFKGIVIDGKVDQDALKSAYSYIKTLLQLSESSNNDLTAVNQKVFVLHNAFFEQVTAQLVGQTVSILYDEIVLSMDSFGTLNVKLQSDFKKLLHKQMK